MQLNAKHLSGCEAVGDVVFDSHLRAMRMHKRVINPWRCLRVSSEVSIKKGHHCPCFHSTPEYSVDTDATPQYNTPYNNLFLQLFLHIQSLLDLEVLVCKFYGTASSSVALCNA